MHGIPPGKINEWVPHNQFYSKACYRLDTFKFWPYFYKFPTYDLAKSGFYYSGQKDIVTCFYCGISIYDWSAIDKNEIHNQHQKHSPYCNYMKMMKENDIEILPDLFSYIRSTDITSDDAWDNEWTPYNISMMTYHKRLNTFQPWPKQMAQKPSDLSLCGFYYSGQGDRVICFHCGISILNWDTTDVISKEHKKHSPICKFMHMSSFM